MKSYDAIDVGHRVRFRDRPHVFEVSGVNNSPHGNTYQLKGSPQWWREADLRRADDPDVREVVRL